MELHKQSPLLILPCHTLSGNNLLPLHPSKANQKMIWSLEGNHPQNDLPQYLNTSHNSPNYPSGCGQGFKNLIADAEFNLVASRAAQAAVLKAVKAGETVVDLSKPDGTDPNGSGGGSGSNSSNGSNGQTPNPNGQYTISVTSANTAQGTVTGGGTFTSGSRIQVVATPKSGYAFDKWSDGNTSATRQITVSQNLNLTAQFKVTEAGGSGTDQTGGSGDNDNQSSTPEF